MALGMGLVAAWPGLLPTARAAADAAEPALPAAIGDELRRLVGNAATTLWGEDGQAPRVEVQVGRLDPRLKLAPCHRIEPYLPAGARPIGSTRVGLRCKDGQARWNVYLPVTVKLWGRALVARAPLPAGTVLQATHLDDAEVDLAASADTVLQRREQAVGRTLAHGLAAGDALRLGDLKLRRWFDTGETVRVVAGGPGFAVSTEGQALNPGIDGQVARVRTEGGRVVSGTATGAHRVELAP